MGLTTLVYVSSATAEFSDAELAALLAHSRERNAARDITGLLLYKGGNFLQVLEGEYDEVIALKSRIARDPRHHGLLVLLVRPLATRRFADWSMAFRRLDDPALAATPGYNPYLNTELTESGIGGDLEPLLEGFRRTLR